MIKIKDVNAPRIKRGPGRPVSPEGKRIQVGFSCTPEALKILQEQNNRSEYICNAIIEKAARDEGE